MRIGDDVRLDIPSLMNTRSDTILSCHRGLATPDRATRSCFARRASPGRRPRRRRGGVRWLACSRW